MEHGTLVEATLSFFMTITSIYVSYLECLQKQNVCTGYFVKLGIDDIVEKIYCQTVAKVKSLTTQVISITFAFNHSTIGV